MPKQKCIKKFNVEAYNNIYKIYLNGKYITAKKYLFEYLEQYPQDIRAKVLLSKVLISLKEYEEARKILEISTRLHPDYWIFIKNMILLYIEQEDYLKAYDYYKKLDLEEYSKINKTESKKLSALRALLFSKLDIPYNEEKFGYLINQYKRYDEEVALLHIYNHHLKVISQENEYNFYTNKEEVKDIYYKARERIQEGSLKDPRLDIVDYYYFKQENIGKSKDNYTNTICVITIKNSNNIITMYPVKKENIPILNDLEKKEMYISGKIRQKKSQIEKFNEKYKLK